MKLRNKKSGNIFTVEFLSNWQTDDGTEIGFRVLDTYNVYSYESLAELNENWEDYKPKEPLIKDEKIRKAVRAWAEANTISSCICKDEMHCITFETERGMFISFETANTIPPEGNFTIAELCGEEE